MAEDDDRPRRAPKHELGQPLDELSLHDFDERLELLRCEIHRLETARAAKARALDAAGSVFRRAGPGA